MIRVVTYNIRAGLGIDGRRSISRIADVLAAISPDIVCLQEVEQHAITSWLANQPKLLATRLGMHSTFQRNLSYGIGGFGNCILSKPALLHCRCHRLPGTGEPRGLLESNIKLDGREITVFCTHLSTEEPVRALQARHVTEIVKTVHSPKILCGDMNDLQHSETLIALLDDPALRDVALEMSPTLTPGTDPGRHRRIDYILADLHFDVSSYEVVDTPASDHRPVVVELELV